MEHAPEAKIMASKKIDHVDYGTLDKAKNAFIQAGKKTLRFAEKYGFIPDAKMGASANVFSLDLKPFLKAGAENLYVTLLPEGLGTADDARPDNLTDQEARKFWYNIGIKTVAVMTNDAASTGMQSILISLYLPSSSPEIVFNENFMKGFLDGFIAGCKTVGCVYFSGETPQLKNKILEGKLDIAGGLFGIMPPGVKPIDSNNLTAGDHIIFIQSSGPHENGFTGLRKLAEKLPKKYRTKLPGGQQFWEAINKGSVLYTPLIQDILASGIQPSNVEPISGHGWQKIMRSQKPFRYVIEKTLPVPEIFQFVQDKTGLSTKEMLKIYNYGVGMAIFVHSEKDAKKVVMIAKKQKLNAVIAGRVEKAQTREVVVKPWKIVLSSQNFKLGK